MYVWLTQRAEPSPHDHAGRRRAMRTGLMADYFANNGWAVKWWTSDFDHFGGRVRGYGTREVSVRDGYAMHYLANQGYAKTRSLKRIRSDANVARDFAKAARAETRMPDVIIASMPSIDLALESVRFGAETGIPVIVDIRDLHPDLFVDMAPAYLRPAVRVATSGMRVRVSRALRGASAIWGNTDGFVEWGCAVAQRTRHTHDSTFPIAYEPVELTDIERTDANSKWDDMTIFRPEEFNIVFFGALSKSFDFAPVFDAAKRLAAAGSRHRFYFFGRGVLEPRVSRHCSETSNSRYLGWAVAQDLQTAMSRSHVGLAPYLSIPNYIRNLPNKPTEYLSGGLGVATALQQGSLVDILQASGAGFSYTSGRDLADKLVRLADDQLALSNMRASAVNTFATRFDRETLSRDMMGAIEALVSGYRFGL